MQSTKTTLVTLASELSHALERNTRDDGSKFYSLKDGSPDWMRDACHAAHGDMMPDDARYELINDVAGALSELDDDADEDGARDAISEIEPDIYTHDLLRWVASRNDRGSYCEEYVESMGISANGFSFTDLLQGGQHMEILETGNLLIEFLVNLAEESQADDDEEDTEEGA